MLWLDRARKAISDLFRRKRFEREMDEELQGFLDLAAAEKERDGATPSEARRLARASLGGLETSKENLRGLRAGSALESVARDARFSIRALRRNPGFAAAAILTIALGIFPLTAVIGLANGVFFLPAPGVTGADQLVDVGFITRDDTGDTDRAWLSHRQHADLVTRVTSLTGLAGHSQGSASVAVAGIGALRVDVEFVSHDYFQVLGMRLAAGRPFAPEEDREPGGTPVVIVGHGLAARLFGDPTRASGQSVLVNGLDFTVVGVAPAEFRGLKNDQYAQMWLPGATSSYSRNVPRERWGSGRGSASFEEFVGRLGPDVELERARTELRVAVQAQAGAAPEVNRRLQTAEVVIEPQPGMSFSTGRMRSEIAQMVTLLASAGALLLLLAGANVGNLMLFRAARRREEMAMRSALGASRWRLVRAQLMETSLIAVAGGAAGMLLTYWVAQLLQSVVVPEVGFVRLPIDWRVGALVLSGSVLVGLGFGVASAWIASSGGLARAVQRVGHRRGRRLRSSLTVMQLSISLPLLVGALLLLVTIRNLTGVDVGFDPARVASASISTSDHGYDERRALGFYRELLARAAAMPGVAAVSVSGGAPFVGTSMQARVQRSSGDQSSVISVAANSVSADYFRVLGLPLVRGRTFSESEAFTSPDGTCGPVVVSQSLATRLFGPRDPLEEVIVLPGTPSRPPLECRVVGVVADVRWNGPGAEWEPILYRPFARGFFRVMVLARSDGPLPLASAALREVAASLDPAIPLGGTPSLAEGIAFQMAERRILSSVLGFLALLGLLMAAVGLYGLVAETVVDRTREFAIRMAIGADGARILRAVLRRAIVLAGIGIPVGIALSVGMAGLIRSQLFGVTAMAAWVYLSAAGLLALVVVLASFAPAIRATRTNPVDVLRAE